MKSEYKTFIALNREQMTVLKKLGSFHKVPVSRIFMRGGSSSSRICVVKVNNEHVFIYNLTDSQEKLLRTLIAKAVTYSLTGESEEPPQRLIDNIDLNNLENILECEEIQDQTVSVKRVIHRMW